MSEFSGILLQRGQIGQKQVATSCVEVEQLQVETAQQVVELVDIAQNLQRKQMRKNNCKVAYLQHVECQPTCRSMRQTSLAVFEAFSGVIFGVRVLGGKC